MTSTTTSADVDVDVDNANGVHDDDVTVNVHVDSTSTSSESLTTCSFTNTAINTNSWIHATAYDLYTHHIDIRMNDTDTTGIHTSTRSSTRTAHDVVTRVEKRAGVIRYSLNHCWNKVLGKYPDALFLEFGVHEGKDICRIAAFVREKERQERASKKKKKSSKHINNKTGTAAANANTRTPTIVHGFDSFQGLPEAWDNGQRVQVDVDVDSIDHTSEGGADTKTKLAFDKGKFDLGGIVPIMESVQEQLQLMGTSKIGNHLTADNDTDNMIGADNDNNDNGNDSCNVQLHAGWFHDTVSDFFDDQQQQLQSKLQLQQQSNSDVTATTSSSSSSISTTASVKVAFVHADADLFSSTVTFLEEICRRNCLVPGSVITFDEYSNYQGWEQGEYRAWMELSQKYNLQWKYLCYHGPKSISSSSSNKQVKWSHYGYQSVSVVITGVPPVAAPAVTDK